MYYQDTTYNHDFNALLLPGPGSRYYKAHPREHIEDYDARYSGRDLSPTRNAGEPFYVQPQPKFSPRGSPVQQRHQMAPDSYRSQGYERRSPPPLQLSPRYERNLPPKNTFAVNSTTQRDYGDFTMGRPHMNDFRSPRGEPDYVGRRQEKPYFDDRDPPSFYKSPRGNDRMPPPEMDRWEKEKRYNGERDDFRRQKPPSPNFKDRELEDMNAGQMRKEMKRMELHDGNFKPHTDHRAPNPNQMNRPGGVLLMIKNNDKGFFDVKKAFESHTGGTPQRQLGGVADCHHIEVKEGGKGWRRMATVARWEGNYYDQQITGDVDQMLSVMWFPSVEDARQWVDRDPHFKHSAFPEPYGNTTSVLPLRSAFQFSPRRNVYMLMDFENIKRDGEQQLERYLSDMEKALDDYDCDAFIVNCVPIPLKCCLFNPRDRVICHRFKSVSDANRFFDGPAQHLRKYLAFAEVSTLIFTLRDVLGK